MLKILLSISLVDDPPKKFRMFRILSFKFYTTNFYAKEETLCKMHLGSWRRSFENRFWKLISIFCFLLNAMVSCCIIYNMFLDEKYLDIEILMIWFDLGNINGYVHEVNQNQIQVKDYRTHVKQTSRCGFNSFRTIPHLL